MKLHASRLRAMSSTIEQTIYLPVTKKKKTPPSQGQETHEPPTHKIEQVAGRKPLIHQANGARPSPPSEPPPLLSLQEMRA